MTSLPGLLRSGDTDPIELRSRLAATGTPVVERVDDATCDVTFVHDDTRLPADEAPRAVRLRSLIDRSLPADLELAPIPGTGLRALTLRLPSTLRFSYGFEVEALDGTRALTPDPLHRRAHRPDPRLDGAIAALPDAEPLPLLAADPSAPAPHLEEVLVPSGALGTERRAWVSLPPPSAVDGDPLPAVIVFDGAAAHSAPLVRDALVASGRVRGCAVVLVDPEGRREVDLTGSDAFTRFLADDLMPLLRGRFGVSTDPAEAVLSGSSFGGLCAGWTALRRPDVFGGAIMQSPSCWYHPDLPGPGGTGSDREGQLARTTPTPLLISAFEDAPRAPVRLFHEVGDLEFGPPPAKVWQVLGNRWLHGVLTAKGYEQVYREFAGGHDPAWWRGTWADALAWMLPAA